MEGPDFRPRRRGAGDPSLPRKGMSAERLGEQEGDRGEENRQQRQTELHGRLSDGGYPAGYRRVGGLTEEAVVSRPHGALGAFGLQPPELAHERAGVALREGARHVHVAVRVVEDWFAVLPDELEASVFVRHIADVAKPALE